MWSFPPPLATPHPQPQNHEVTYQMLGCVLYQYHPDKNKLTILLIDFVELLSLLTFQKKC